MPLASSNDLIIAGIHDSLHALQHLSTNALLAPVSDSHHDALVQLTELLTSLAAPPCSIPIPAPALPVADSPPPLITTPPVMADPPLRVDRVPSPRTPDPSLRVALLSTPVIPLTKGVVIFGPLPSPTGGGTLENSTGAAGLRRRRTRRNQRAPRPLVAAKTIHPNKLTPVANPRTPAHHPHGTQSQKTATPTRRCGRCSC